MSMSVRGGLILAVHLPTVQTWKEALSAPVTLATLEMEETALCMVSICIQQADY